MFTLKRSAPWRPWPTAGRGRCSRRRRCWGLAWGYRAMPWPCSRKRRVLLYDRGAWFALQKVPCMSGM